MLLKEKRIFMVEDNLANKAIQTLLLEQNGASVTIERWGTRTVEILRKNMPIDLIILDLMLPGEVTGYQVFEKIREVPEFDHIPIIAVSASNPSEAIPKTRMAGFNGYISKPIDFDRFPEQIARILAGQSVWTDK